MPPEAVRDEGSGHNIWSRRELLSLMGWGAVLTSIGASVAAFGVFMFPRVLFEPPTRWKAGFPTDFTVNTVSSRWMDDYRCWIVRWPGSDLFDPRGLHAPGLHPELSLGGKQVQVSLPRHRLPADRHQLRRSRAASARARLRSCSLTTGRSSSTKPSLPVELGQWSRSGGFLEGLNLRVARNEEVRM